MVTTIQQYAQQSLANYLARQATAKTEYADLSTQLKAALEATALLVKEMVVLGEQITAKRAAMSDESLAPADVIALAGELRVLLIAQRAKYAELLAAQDTEISLGRQKDQIEGRLSLLDERVSDAQTALTAATVQHDERTAWKQGVTDGLFADVKSRATDVLDAVDDGAEPAIADHAVIWKANNRVEGDIPAVLLVRARQRGAQIDQTVTDRRSAQHDTADALATQSAADAGLAGVVTQRSIEFERAEAAFKSVVLLSDGRYDQALSLLAGVVSSPVLTTDQADRITAMSLLEGDDALVKEKARDDAQDAVLAKQVELETAILAALVADVDADPDDDATVQTLQDELDNAATGLRKALADAQADYDATLRAKMDLWEGAIPDHIWNNLAAYDRAVALLTEIKDADAATLSASMDGAEATVAQALAAEDKARRLDDVLDERLSLAGARFEDMNNAYSAQLLSRLRGDN